MNALFVRGTGTMAAMLFMLATNAMAGLTVTEPANGSTHAAPYDCTAYGTVTGGATVTTTLYKYQMLPGGTFGYVKVDEQMDTDTTGGTWITLHANLSAGLYIIWVTDGTDTIGRNFTVQ